MQTHNFNTSSKQRISGDDHPTLTGRNRFCSVEAEYGHVTAQSPYELAIVCCGDRVRRVFDDIQSMTFCDGEDFFHRSGKTRIVDGDDCLGASSDGSFNTLRIDTKRTGINVYKYR